MQTKRNLLTGGIAAAVLATGSMGLSAPAFSQTAPGINLDAGIDVSNMYLFRGDDLGDGAPLVAGWLEASTDLGFYAGAWTAGGDIDSGTEIDLYGGYAFDLTDDVSLDFHVTNFIFLNGARTQQDIVTNQEERELVDSNGNPTGNFVQVDTVSVDDVPKSQTGFADFTEVGVTASAFGAEFTYLNNVAGGAGFEYFNAGYGYGPFSIAVGHNSFDDSDEDNTHLDLGFQFNDELSFTVSQLLDTPDGERDTTHLSVMYSKAFSFN